MYNIIKRSFCVTMCLSFLLFTGKNNIYASEYVMDKKTYNDKEFQSIQVKDDIPNLLNNYDEKSVVCQKLQNDCDDHITILTKEKEEKLNKMGVFDREIQNLDSETLEEIQNAPYMQVYTYYTAVDEETGETFILDSKEVDELISNDILEEKNNSNCIEDGIMTLDSTSSVSSSGAMKHTVYATQYAKEGVVYVTATATWLEEAYYRNVDIYGVCLANAHIVDGSYSCTHTATYTFLSFETGKQISQRMTTNPTNPTPSGSGDGVAYKVNLFSSRSTLISIQLSGAGVEHYRDETIIIRFRCMVDNKNISQIYIVPHYLHSKTEINLSPNIAFGGGGASIGVSGSNANYYTEITNSPILAYTYK